MGIDIIRISATTLGATGSAAAMVSSSSVSYGHVSAIHLGVEAGGTADIGVSMAREVGSETVLSLVGISISGWYYPRKQACSNSGILSYSLGGPVLDRFIIGDQINMNITNATTDKTFTASIYVET
jgi:hypothetical protein